MEDKEQKELFSENNDNKREGQEHTRPGNSTQVPPMLLPTVLQRLGLSPEIANPEISVKALVEQLHSPAWEERLNALRALERLESSVPVELLAAYMKDDDASVRAAALCALRNAGRDVPLHLLITALNDTNWHVREMAVLALGKQGQRVPQEVLQTALHDKDHMVQEAATLALQWYTTSVELENTAVLDGQRWEQYIMQQKESHPNGQTTRALSDEDQSTTPISYSSGTSRPMRVLYEQQQTYAAQGSTPDPQWKSYTPQDVSGAGQMQMHAQMEETSEAPPQERQRDPQQEASYEYNSGASTVHGEKLTSLPSRSRRAAGWWIILVVIVALIFFMVGRVSSTSTQPFQRTAISAPAIGAQQNSGSDAGVPSSSKLTLDVQFASQARQEIADGLKLSPDDITNQLSTGKTMQEIASNQGISANQLHKIELSAINNLINSEVKAGKMDDKGTKDALQRLQDNPGTLDRLAQILFLIPDTMPIPPSTQN